MTLSVNLANIAGNISGSSTLPTLAVSTITAVTHAMSDGTSLVTAPLGGGITSQTNPFNDGAFPADMAAKIQAVKDQFPKE